MTRVSRPQMFMEIAHVVAKRSTCFRESVGAIVVKNGRIISIGYNGPVSGAEPCSHHPDGQCRDAIHAEMNAIRFIEGLQLNLDMYCTHFPCPDCAKFIVESGLFNRLFFSTIYGEIEKTQELFNAYSVGLYRVIPSGLITTPDRKEIINVQ